MSTDVKPSASEPRVSLWLQCIVKLEWLFFIPLVCALFLLVVFSFNKYDLEWLYFPGWVEFIGAVALVILIRKFIYWTIPTLTLAEKQIELIITLKEFKKDLKQFIARKDISTTLRKEADSLLIRLSEQIQTGTVFDMTMFEKELEQWFKVATVNLSWQRNKRFLGSIAIALTLAISLRIFGYEIFKVPTGSMIPTIQVGDHVLVNKFVYGLRIPLTDIKIATRSPQRGDIVVFVCPPTIPSCVKAPEDYVKRVIAIGGDVVDFRNGSLYVNDQLIPTEKDPTTCSYEDVKDGKEYTYRDAPRSEWYTKSCVLKKETSLGLTYDTVYDDELDNEKENIYPIGFPRKIPEGSIFVMGDNRDHSNDSRYWGEVPSHLIKGRADRVVWSVGPTGNHRVRLDRIGKRLMK